LDAPPRLEALTFETVYEKYFTFVWSVTRRFGVPDEAVDDIVQETFVVVYTKLSTLEDPSAVRSWLYGIVRKCSSRHHRKAKAGRLDYADLDEMPSLASFETPADLAVRSDSVRLLWEVLNALDEPKREIFILAEVHELSCPEIAEALKIPLNTAYSRLRHAREAFELALARLRARKKL
jgi:RNA polymerase sigma-70 factor, ECF subfamily